jgi:hypothetical protein
VILSTAESAEETARRALYDIVKPVRSYFYNTVYSCIRGVILVAKWKKKLEMGIA